MEPTADQAVRPHALRVVRASEHGLPFEPPMDADSWLVQGYEHLKSSFTRIRVPTCGFLAFACRPWTRGGMAFLRLLQLGHQTLKLPACSGLPATT